MMITLYSQVLRRELRDAGLAGASRSHARHYSHLREGAVRVPAVAVPLPGVQYGQVGPWCEPAAVYTEGAYKCMY